MAARGIVLKKKLHTLHKMQNEAYICENLAETRTIVIESVACLSRKTKPRMIYAEQLIWLVQTVLD